MACSSRIVAVLENLSEAVLAVLRQGPEPIVLIVTLHPPEEIPSMPDPVEIRLTPTQRQLVELQTPPAPDGKPTSIDTVEATTGDPAIATIAPFEGDERRFYVQSAGPNVIGTTTLACNVDARQGSEVVTLQVPTITVIVGEPEATSGQMVPVGEPEEIPGPVAA